MRILIDIRLLSRGSTTGIPGYTRELINAVLEADDTISLILLYAGIRRSPLPAAWTSHPRVTVITIPLPNRLLNIIFRFFKKPSIESLCKYYRVAPPDSIFSPHFNLLPPSSLPRIITFHDLSFMHYPQFFSRAQRAWHAMQQYEEQAHQATALVAVSEFTKSDLIEKFNIHPRKITVVHSGISASMRELSSAEKGQLLVFKEERKLPKHFILHLGSLEPRKNLSLLIASFNEFKKSPSFADYWLILAGYPGYQARILKREIQNSPHREQIRIIDDLRDEERSLLYQSSRMLVFPSFFEGFGFPPLEAQACGIPVIASDRSSLAEILHDSALAINPWDATATARAMQDLETKPDLRSGIIRRGKENAARFNWREAALTLIRLFATTITVPHANKQSTEKLARLL